MENPIVPRKDAEVDSSPDMAAAGQAANRVAAKRTFKEYKDRKAANTLKRQQADLRLFADFLRLVQLTPGDFYNDPQAWRDITWGLVDTFVGWQVLEGYALGSINVRMATVKTFAQLSVRAGTLGAGRVREYLEHQGLRPPGGGQR